MADTAERMEKEAEEERVRKQRAAAERAFQEGIAKTKLVMRRTPLGMDRNHNRSGSRSSSRRLRSTENLCFSSKVLLLPPGRHASVSSSFPSRYWLFSDVVPGLYIEKGWVHESIDYSFTPPPEDKPAEPEVQEEEEDDEEEDEEAGSAANDGAKRWLKRRCTKVLEGEVLCFLFFFTSVCVCRS